jgi:hypothetical protein
MAVKWRMRAANRPSAFGSVNQLPFNSGAGGAISGNGERELLDLVPIAILVHCLNAQFGRAVSERDPNDEFSG